MASNVFDHSNNISHNYIWLPFYRMPAKGEKVVISKLGRRGQLTLPSEVRRKAKLKEGDQVAFIIEGEHIVLQPLTQTLLDLRGSVAVTGPQDFAAIRQHGLAARASRNAGHGE